MMIQDTGLRQLYGLCMCEVWTGTSDAGQPVVVYVAGIGSAAETAERLRRVAESLEESRCRPD